MSPHAPDDGLESAEDIRLQARVKGQGHAYQVVNGTQSIVHHHHYEGLEAPLALPDLRLWIDRMTTDYRTLTKASNAPLGRRRAASHAKELDALQHDLATLAKSPKDSGQLRRLLAAGAAQYLYKCTRLPAEPLPESVMVDLAVFALWPVIQTPALPSGWHDELAQLTSPRLALLVAQARQAGEAGRPVGTDLFGRALAAKPFAHGILALLEDLGDPRGGGACLTPIALAQGFTAPPRKAEPKAMLAWLLGAAAAGGAGATTAAELADESWAWIHRQGRGPAGPQPTGDADLDDDGHIGTHRGTSRIAHGTRTEADGNGFLDDLLN
ncbi:hypothetical protein [Streptomyces sp. NBC_00887]|uniref:hypothetical protein n=1 Tax=Streptomyces sp. NBC_00887 TaxID=2975859 RepID=UPI0038645EF5|nr:hypothetical protein OG844_00200 [Streptomyces sp. NBC_00887]WSY36372.1 hypothetical protein OG844_45400 [Streptomyces sp. NBC_00887]